MSFDERKRMASLIEVLEFAIHNVEEEDLISLLAILVEILERLRQLQPEQAKAA